MSSRSGPSISRVSGKPLNGVMFAAADVRRIPFDRALDFANKEKITELLYPLFVHNIGALLYHPANQARESIGNAAMAAGNDGSLQAMISPRPELEGHTRRPEVRTSNSREHCRQFGLVIEASEATVDSGYRSDRGENDRDRFLATTMQNPAIDTCAANDVSDTTAPIEESPAVASTGTGSPHGRNRQPAPSSSSIRRLVEIQNIIYDLQRRTESLLGQTSMKKRFSIGASIRKPSVERSQRSNSTPPPMLRARSRTIDDRSSVLETGCNIEQSSGESLSTTLSFDSFRS